MEEGQNFCLQWNSYQTSVTSLFNDLRRDGELVDVTLCAQGQQIKVHRMMLSACSPYFRDVLKGNLGTHPVFFMRDISFKDLSNIVEFVYRGKVNVAQSDLASFLKTAEALQIRGLTGDDEAGQSEPPRKSKPSTPSAPPPPRLSPEPRARAAPEPPRQRPPPAAPAPAPAPAPAAAPSPAKRTISPSPAAEERLTPKRPRSVDHAPAAGDHSASQGGDGVMVKEEPLVLDVDNDVYCGENSAGSGVMPLVGDGDGAHMGFLGAAPAHGQPHDFQDEDLLAAVAGPSGFPSQDHSQDSATPGGGQAAPSYRCPLCGKLMHPLNRSHHKAWHEGRTTCQSCGRVFTRINLLTAHLAQTPCGSAHSTRRPETAGHRPDLTRDAGSWTRAREAEWNRRPGSAEGEN